MDDLQAEFNRQMDALYASYLKHCKEVNITPLNKERFAAGVGKQIDRTAEIMASGKVSAVEGPTQQVFIAIREEDATTDGLPFTTRICGQCQHVVVINPAMQEVADKSYGIICNQCTPEIMGKTYGEIISGLGSA